MTPVILIEMVLVFGTTVAWGLYQLYQLRPDERQAEPGPKEVRAKDAEV